MLCACALVLLALAGCAGLDEGIPRPDTVYVDPPGQVEPGLTEGELWERYTTSPNRNPDGLGVLPAMWLNSRMTLVVKELRLERERGNRIAYARSDAEQEAVLQRLEAHFDRYIVFEGTIISDIPKLADATWYTPEGIYLLDDRKRKFLPVSVKSHESVFTAHQLFHVTRFSNVTTSVPHTILFPYLLFPAEAITPETRAITLYFAAFQRRLSFTWVFDESYVPETTDYSPEHGRGFQRMWRNR